MIMKKTYPLVFMIAATSLMPLGIVAFPVNVTLFTVTLYISAIAGYIGIAFLLWIYILGARGVTRFFHDDIGALLKLHDWMGKYGTLLIFLHPIFITISYGKSWLYTFSPNIATEYDFYVTLGQIALYLLLIVWLASFILRSKLKYRPWKYIHFISYLILPFALIHIPSTGSSYAVDIVSRLYFWMIVIGFVLFTLFRLRSALGSDRQQYTVIKHDNVGDRVYIIQLKPQLETQWVKPKYGQYIYLRTGVVSEEHPFSVLDYQPKTGVITIAYKVYGRFTNKLSTIKPGDNMMVSRAYGSFTSEISSKPVVYIAGGVGVTPFVSRLINESNHREQWLRYANRNAKSAILLEYLSKSLGKQLINIYSEVDGVSIDRSLRGKMFRKSLLQSISKPSDYEYYMCGPNPLMDSMETELGALGVPKDAIHRESFGF